MMYNMRIGAIRWKMPDLLSDGNTVVFALSRTVCEIFTNPLKCKNSAFENVQFRIGDLFQNFSYLGTYGYANWIYTYTYSMRQREISKQNLKSRFA